MENSLKQRIVGAVVLIALAVIFLPSILKDKDKQVPFQSKIPPKPISSIETKLPEDVIRQNKQTQASLDQLEQKIHRKTKQVDINKNRKTSSEDQAVSYP